VSALATIVSHQDAKIADCLAGGGPMLFWYAQCPLAGDQTAQSTRLHELGFDNYPVAYLPGLDAVQTYLFFFERILGVTLHGVEGGMGDFFRTWCPPLIHQPDEVWHLAIDLAASPTWYAYETVIRNYLRETPVAERLPIVFPGLSPLDMACNLCGTEQFFLLLYEAPDAADHLLGFLTDLLIEAYHRIAGLGARLVTAHGFPGVYCSDLQMPYISPPLLARLLLPRYARLAAACGGLCCAVLCADVDIMASILSIDGVIGCAFDKRLPLNDLAENLASKLFLLPHYCYHDTLDVPTVQDGIYCNPIVQSYSRELPALYQALAGRANLAISIERPSLAEVCAVREALNYSQDMQDG